MLVVEMKLGDNKAAINFLTVAQFGAVQFSHGL
jgi:hypothetical protein